MLIFSAVAVAFISEVAGDYARRTEDAPVTLPATAETAAVRHYFESTPDPDPLPHAAKQNSTNASKAVDERGRKTN